MINAVNEWVIELRGLSTDRKPLKKDYKFLGNGSTMLEMDTAKLFMYDAENDRWIDISKVN